MASKEQDEWNRQHLVEMLGYQRDEFREQATYWRERAEKLEGQLDEARKHLREATQVLQKKGFL